MNQSINIIELNHESWEILYNQSDMGLFLSPEWIKSMANGNNNAVYLKLMRNDSIVGLIAGVLLNNGKGKGRSLYFYSGPYLHEWSVITFEACLNAILLYSKKKRYARLYIKSYDYQVCSDIKIKGYYRLTSKEFIINLHDKDLKLSSNFTRNVKKASKSGAVFYKSTDPVILDKMLLLITNTYKTRLGKYGLQYNPMYMANLNRHTLNELLQCGLGKLNCVELDGEIQSIMFTLEKNKKIYFLLMGSSQASYNNGIPSFLSYTLTEEAIKKGFKYYNMGLIPSKAQGGEGVRRFKESQGATEYSSFSYYTLFLSFPWCLLNPFFKLSKLLPDNNLFNYCRRFFT